MRFSIIVPVYNTALYLSECIDSVLVQKCRDWELIIVDDGSTDGSGEMADEYANRYENIRVVHKKNEGQFRARRDGLSQAVGEYVLFLDSDDYWSPDFLETLNSAVEEKSPDVIAFAGERFGDDTRKNNVIGVFSEETEWCEKQKMYRILISGNDCNSLCLKAMKRSLFDGDNADYDLSYGTFVGEDKIQLLYPISRAEKILWMPDVLYHYRYNTESTVHKVNFDRIPHMMANTMFEAVYSYAQKWGLNDADGREAMAVYYIRQFLHTFFAIRKSCKSKNDREKLRRYPWNETFDKRALKYAFSRRLSLKEKIKLGVALIFVHL